MNEEHLTIDGSIIYGGESPELREVTEYDYEYALAHEAMFKRVGCPIYKCKDLEDAKRHLARESDDHQIMIVRRLIPKWERYEGDNE